MGLLARRACWGRSSSRCTAAGDRPRGRPPHARRCARRRAADRIPLALSVPGRHTVSPHLTFTAYETWTMDHRKAVNHHNDRTAGPDFKTRSAKSRPITFGPLPFEPRRLVVGLVVALHAGSPCSQTAAFRFEPRRHQRQRHHRPCWRAASRLQATLPLRRPLVCWQACHASHHAWPYSAPRPSRAPRQAAAWPSPRCAP